LVVNLDARMGKAWRLRESSRGLTLMPSVWRTSGCRSHFVLWNSTVWWCRLDEDDETPSLPRAATDELRAVWERIRDELRARSPKG